MSGQTAWREPPPPRTALIRWPESFGRRYLIWCDVEEEFDWDGPFTRDRHGVTAIAALPAMHRRLAAAGVAPIYMIDHPVAASPVASAIIAPLLIDGTTFGAQLHPWVNPPFVEPLTGGNSFVGNLPPALQAAKIDVLTTVLTDAFGTPPIAFRAGRYGIGAATASLLAGRGYRVDSSVRARYDYRAIGGPDFGAIGNAAYYRPDGLIELPLSTVYTGGLRRLAQRLHAVAGRLPRGQGLLARAGLVNRVSLTPEGMPIGEALAAVDAARAANERLLSLSFHSPSLVPGHTPFVCDAADLLRFDRWWDSMLSHLDMRGYRPATLAETLAAASSEPPA